MNKWKYTKCFRYGLISLVIILCTLFLGYLTPTKWFYRTQTDCTYPIYISSVNHFHAELIIPVTTAAFDWRTDKSALSHLILTQLGSHSDAYQYLSFGWGDRKFFMNGSLDPISIFDGLFLPSPTAMNVWGHTEEPSQWPKDFEIKQVQLNRAWF